MPVLLDYRTNPLTITVEHLISLETRAVQHARGVFYAQLKLYIKSCHNATAANRV